MKTVFSALAVGTLLLFAASCKKEDTGPSDFIEFRLDDTLHRYEVAGNWKSRVTTGTTGVNDELWLHIDRGNSNVVLLIHEYRSFFTPGVYTYHPADSLLGYTPSFYLHPNLDSESHFFKSKRYGSATIEYTKLGGPGETIEGMFAMDSLMFAEDFIEEGHVTASKITEGKFRITRPK